MNEVLNKSWFMKYMPLTKEDIVFDNDQYKNLVYEWIDNRIVPGNCLFFGPWGTGKTTCLEVIVKSILPKGAKSDLLMLDSRKVASIDDELIPFIKKSPVVAKQKFVIIEELDRMSKASIGTIKNKLLEKFQDECVFLATTNYISKIEGAVLQRFTYKIPFNGSNSKGIFERLKKILDYENAGYSENKLLEYVEINHNTGIRELINRLQVSYFKNNKSIDFDNIDSGSSLNEKIIKLMLNIINSVIDSDKDTKFAIINTPHNSIVKEDYINFQTTVHNNSYDIDLNLIIGRLDEELTFIPIKKVLFDYSSKTDNVRFNNMFLISMLYEIMRAINEIYPG